jgi:nucleotide-binding universal stress UspA family protein
VYYPKNLVESQRAEAEASLERLVRAAKELGLTGEWHLKTGSASDAVLESARTLDVDLTVMATHGRTGLAHVWCGSVTETVLRRAPCPMLVVRPLAAAPRPFQRILVPLDGSPLAEAILPHAVEMARRYQATLLLLRVTEAHTFPGVDPVDAQVRVVAEAEAYLAEVERSLAAAGVAVDCAVRYGHATEEIIDHAERRKADLIAMSTHGRTGLPRAALGSVAETVLRASSVPLLLLPMTARAKAGANSEGGGTAVEVA